CTGTSIAAYPPRDTLPSVLGSKSSPSSAFVATSSFFFFFNAPATPEIYTLSLHDALPIPGGVAGTGFLLGPGLQYTLGALLLWRSEEHTSELQSRENLVCRLLLEKKKTISGTLKADDQYSHPSVES